MTEKNYDSAFCGRVPLHQTNMVQPHGILMIVDKQSGKILQVSENVEALLGKPAPQVVQTHLSDYISTDQYKNLQNRFEGSLRGKLPFTMTFVNGQANVNGQAKDFIALVQTLEEYLLVEIEKEALEEAPHSFINVYGELKFILSAIDATTTIEEAARIVGKELKRISGFDKVMVYKFDEGWNGTVLAEEAEEGMDAYLGLKFPASDIPKGAREMYRKTPYRLIPDRDYQPVRLYPVINPATHAFTDLSHTNLRSVAGVHIEYLQNMNVTASMSTRILKNDQLWGLISCHHRTPKYLSYQTCSLFELLSDIISAKIAALEQQQLAHFKAEMHQVYAEVVEGIYKNDHLVRGIAEQQQEVMNLLKADGLATIFQKDIQTFGNTPSVTDIEDLVYWLQASNAKATHQETALSSKYENAAAYAAEASGLLVLPIQPDRGAYILAFRPEAVRKVTWGGNPDEAIQFSADQKSYHPRASFQQWQQTVSGQALPWSPEALEIAENFRNFVISFTLNKM